MGNGSKKIHEKRKKPGMGRKTFHAGMRERIKNRQQFEKDWTAALAWTVSSSRVPKLDGRRKAPTYSGDEESKRHMASNSSK